MGILCSDRILWVVLGLNTDMNEKKKKHFQFLKGGSPERKTVMWVVGLTDNLILCVVGQNIS